MEENRDIYSKQSLNEDKLIELINRLVYEKKSEKEMREAIIKELR